MSGLYAMVKNLLVIIILASFLEILLPDGRLKPFVRFSVGLFVLIAILSPALNLLFHNPNLTVSFWDYQISQAAEQQIQEQGADLNRKVMQRNQEIIRDKVQGQISAVTSLVPGVNDVHTEVQVAGDGSLEKVELTVSPDKPEKVSSIARVNAFSGSREPVKDEEQQNISNKIIQVISNLYGIPGQNVQIKFEGG